MYQWYRDSDVCYAYIEDVSNADALRISQSSLIDKAEISLSPEWKNDPIGRSSPQKSPADDAALQQSRWFTRGWTLQELVAPKDVQFFAAEWCLIGHKESLAKSLAKITKVPQDILLHLRSLSDCSIAQRMSWASQRRTTRIEDIAYCLMGIFDVQMPLLYGEGENAFVRLQKEIIAQNADQSIFAWTGSCAKGLAYLAKSPQSFIRTGSFTPVSRVVYTHAGGYVSSRQSTAGASHRISHRGLEITTGIVHIMPTLTAYAILNCFDTQHGDRRLAIELDPFDHWHPGKATEFTVDGLNVENVTTVELALSVKLKELRSIIILNDDSDLDNSTKDVRVRCLFDCGLNSISSVAGPPIDGQELSFDIERCDPKASWDSYRSILTVPDACKFEAKLRYTPSRQCALGKRPSESSIVVNICWSSHGWLMTKLHFEHEAPFPRWYPVSMEPQEGWHIPRGAMSRKGRRRTNGLWNIEVLLIDPSETDPLRTLAIAVKPLRSWRRAFNQTLALFELGKQVTVLSWILRVRLGKTRRMFEDCIEHERERDRDREDIQNHTVSNLTVEDLYGSRRRWRQAYLHA
jgi:hypothetical protein